MERLGCVAIGYACGCVLFAEVVARVIAKQSIFELGNGNPGMANTARSLGKLPALLCLAGDLGKVALAAAVCHALFPGLGRVAVGWAGIGATLGHDFPVWRGFRGGKGVATLSATLVLLSPLHALVAGLVAGVCLWLTGYLSIAAVAASAAFALLSVTGGTEMTVVACIACVLAVAGQWGNLRGIKTGEAKRDLKRR